MNTPHGADGLFTSVYVLADFHHVSRPKYNFCGQGNVRPSIRAGGFCCEASYVSTRKSERATGLSRDFHFGILNRPTLYIQTIPHEAFKLAHPTRSCNGSAS